MGRQIPLWECFPVFEGSLVPLLRESLPFAGKSAPLLENRRRFGEWGKGRWKDGFAPPKGGGVGFWGARPCGFGGFYAENPILAVIFSFRIAFCIRFLGLFLLYPAWGKPARARIRRLGPAAAARRFRDHYDRLSRGTEANGGRIGGGFSQRTVDSRKRAAKPWQTRRGKSGAILPASRRGGSPPFQWVLFPFPVFPARGRRIGPPPMEAGPGLNSGGRPSGGCLSRRFCPFTCRVKPGRFSRESVQSPERKFFRHFPVFHLSPFPGRLRPERKNAPPAAGPEGRFSVSADDGGDFS